MAGVARLSRVVVVLLHALVLLARAARVPGATAVRGVAGLSADAWPPTPGPKVPATEVAPGVWLPLAGLGTWQYNDTVAYGAVRAALDLGYPHIDTALGYRNQRGVGKALKDSGRKRKDVFITSKIPGGLNTSATTAAVEQCLDELGTDYIDLMLIHFPAAWSGEGGKALRQEEWLALEPFVKKGVLRAIGVSHYCPRHLLDVLEVATVPVAVNQVQYHVGMGTSGTNASDGRAFMESVGVTFQSFSPLCGPCGTKELLTGELVTKIGAAHGKSGAQVSLKWLVQQNIPVIPKSDKPDHLKENLDLFGWELSQQEMAALTLHASPEVAGNPGPPATSGDCDVL